MKITSRQVEKFRTEILNCNTPACAAFLDKAETFQFPDYKVLVAFHDALLLLEAYPCSEELFHRANNLLRNYEILTKRFLKKNKSASAKLINSGLKGTEVQGAFTYLLLWGMATQKNKCLYLHSIDEDGMPVADVIKHFLPAAEFEVVNGDYTSEELLDELFGNEFPLHGLVQAMTLSPVSRALRDQLFDAMKIYAGIKLDGSVPDRSTARVIVNEVFVQSSLERKPVPSEVIARPLPPPENLTWEQKLSIQQNAMYMLATLNRETDPITNCDLNSITLFNLDRGFSVALFSTTSDLRMPFESYIGYMLYRNGVPMAYGGAWVFGNRALFGINIFEPFRGGESSLIMLQLLRVYHQYFGVEAFSVEPYQFGKDNREGIESGAYWFYYKMGFRSDDTQLARLAEREFAKMKKSKQYRSSASTLKKFTDARVTLKLSDARIFPEPNKLSEQITAMIRKKFAGDRQAAIKQAMSAYNYGDFIFHSWALLYSLKGKTHAEFMDTVAELVRLKHVSEREYNLFLISRQADIQ